MDEIAGEISDFAKEAPAQIGKFVGKEKLKKLRKMKGMFVDTSYDVALTGVNFGLTVGTALAWNDYFKGVIKTLVGNGKKTNYALMYPIAMTLLTVIIFMILKYITNREVKPKLPDMD
uniref:Uncharacterized protein n=1 Tax=viral metagenome TaxID=1070528 RepID=A0A6C0F5F3_9ZZZZ|tara:strand:- start:27407 stop:27760 length:354 start_codon:yes stop_codon:yes gene_type:complete